MNTISKYFLFLVVLFVQCSTSEKIKKEKEFSDLVHRGFDAMNKAFFEDDSTYLDSALIYFNRAEALRPDKRNEMSYNKAHAYFNKRAYDSAVLMINRMPDSVFVFAVEKPVFIESILAKKASYEMDTAKRNVHYRNIVAYYDDFIKTYRSFADSLMKSSDGEKISNTRYGMFLAMRYCFSARLNGKQRTIQSLDSLQEVSGYNSDYMNWLKDLIAGDKNQSIQILFD